MYDHWQTNVLLLAVAAVAVMVNVFIHYEGLHAMSHWMGRFSARHRSSVLYGVYGVLLLHILEIWVFGALIWFLLRWPEVGQIIGSTASLNSLTHALDILYLSAVTYTTVGFGDLTVVGPIRFLIATEALIGFILIAWSASFLYLKMDKYWHKD